MSTKALTILFLAILPAVVAAGNQGAREAIERELSNLVAYFKLIGYLRYFHPSDESAAAKWDIVAI